MKKIVLLIFTISMLAACGGSKEVKRPSAESLAYQESEKVVETIRQAFVTNDRVAIQKNSTEEGYRDITASKRLFDSLELVFTPRWFEIEQGRQLLNVSWTSVWINSGKKTEDRGMAVFVLEGRPLKVSKIMRANPFIHPEQ